MSALLTLVAALAYCILSNIGSSIRISSKTTVDGLIAETGDTLDLIRQDEGKGYRWYTTPRKQYNLTDVISIQQRNIHLNGFCIQTHTHFKYLQILSCHGLDSFIVNIAYPRNRISALNASILDINAAVTNPTLTGTEAMLLIHYILSGLGVRSCSLQ